MPARRDIEKILIIGSGPIIIGQGCEFDYSGNQAVRALKEEGYKIVLHNPNPATVMTTVGNVHSIYFDPLEKDFLIDILEKEKPDAVLATMGGQSALNLVIEVEEAGVFDALNTELIGVNIESIKTAEDRGLFKEKMNKIGLRNPFSILVENLSKAKEAVEKIGFPLIIRPSFTLGGRGGSIAYNIKEFESKVRRALDMSFVHTVILEESLLGYQEFEFEVMRDKADNAVIVCAIENIDPMGIHTGDSITVAPIQTLSDVEYQTLRSISIDILRAVGVDCGGSNVQLAFHPHSKRLLVIEMNPRVSRSSALASKATGFPIARCAAKLAVGYTLDEIMNEITQKTTAFFEPTLDYCAVKIPRFELKKFNVTQLGTQMQSVGESLSLGRTFPEALNKALRAAEIGVEGLEELKNISEKELEHIVSTLHPKRIFGIYTMLLHALKKDDQKENIQRKGCNTKYVKSVLLYIEAHTFFHPWVLFQILEIAKMEYILSLFVKISDVPRNVLGKAKKMSFSDSRLAKLYNTTALKIKKVREDCDICTVFHSVDTCAGEFKAETPYFYATFSEIDENVALVKDTKKGGNITEAVAIIGSGPNRIGQGLEFDTCCTMASLYFRKKGFQSVMINSNPETVSTDYNVSSRLYLEPLHIDDVSEILEKTNIKKVMCQLGGQTSINMAEDLEKRGFTILGTSVNSINATEDRQLFLKLLSELKINQAPGRTVTKSKKILAAAKKIGFPVLIRPSYVLGGQSMVVVYSEAELVGFVEKNTDALENNTVLIDKFLEGATEYDVDAVCDGKDIYIAGVLSHIEHAGVHSGDSACVFESKVLSGIVVQKIYDASYKIAVKLQIKGFINIQFAAVGDEVYVIEVNPRASRTIPFITKVSGVNVVDLGVDVCNGVELASTKVFKTHLVDETILGIAKKYVGKIAIGYSKEGWAVKEAVFSFDRFQNVDPALSPQMRSTGEVIGIGGSFGEAFAKASAAAFCKLPKNGTVFISVAGKYKDVIVPYAKQFVDMDFVLIGTRGTAMHLQANNIVCEIINRVADGVPHVLDKIESGDVDLVINILESVDEKSFRDDKEIRLAVIRYGIPYVSTLPTVAAAIEGIRYLYLTKKVNSRAVR